MRRSAEEESNGYDEMRNEELVCMNNRLIERNREL